MVPEAPEFVSLPSDLSDLSSLIDEQLEAFASGSQSVQEAALKATKFVFDLALTTEARSHEHISELLESITSTRAPQTRSQARAAPQKDTSLHPSIRHAILQSTPLSCLFVDGMDEDQLWAQLDLKAKNVCDTLEDALNIGGAEDQGHQGDDESLSDAEGSSDETEDLDELMQLDNPSREWGMVSSGEESDDDEDEDEEDEEFGEEVTGLRDPSSEEEADDDEDVTVESYPQRGYTLPRKRKARGHPELDDDFFSLAAFNAETEEAETKHVSKGALSKDSDDEDEEDEEVDLFASVDNIEAFDEDDLEETDAGETFYKDFFEPPPRSLPSKPTKKVKGKDTVVKRGKVRFSDQVQVKSIKSKGKGRPVPKISLMDSRDEDDLNERLVDEDDDEASTEGQDDAEESEGDTGGSRETIERLKDDLFAADEVVESELTSHETRMAALRDQIATLEAENVGKKDWTLMGEATSRSRNKNALLEEDLDFERVMKTVPVITQEVVQNLEEKIKGRILEGRFDDVVRRQPLHDKPFLPSRFFELQDTKSTQSLAQIYEEEYVAARTGGVAGEDRDGKLKKEHEEIEKLWENICTKLDALCNAHFTPKPPKMTISTVSNVSTITLESALPTTKSVSTVLAPEEVFSASASDFRARSELTHAEKKTLRAKERLAKKKQRQTLEKGVDKYAKANQIKGVKRQKEEALKSVVKRGKGVTIIGKKSQEMKTKKKSSAS